MLHLYYNLRTPYPLSTPDVPLLIWVVVSALGSFLVSHLMCVVVVLSLSLLFLGCGVIRLVGPSVLTPRTGGNSH